MLDIKWIRENPAALDAALSKRNAAPQAEALLALDTERRDVVAQAQALQSRRNEISKEVGMAKAKGEDRPELFEEMKSLGPKLKELEEAERSVNEKLNDALSRVPNIPAEQVPAGVDEEDNEIVRTWGEPTQFSFEPKPHYEVGENLGLLDFETAATMAGSRFVWQQGDLARLERALAAFMLDFLGSKGFKEVNPPLLLNTASLYGTGQLPKFEEDQFETTDGRWLLPTSEVPLTNYAQGKIFKEDELPFKFCAWTPNFRKEAGSAGRDTRGLIRMHQFFKVEMVQLVHPEKSVEAHQEMVGCEEGILQALELPYRMVNLCGGDLGFGATQTFDMEVWLPAQNTYREISSCSNCGDFQARRMNARFKGADGKNRFIHTLNGSGLAVGRTLAAVIENYPREISDATTNVGKFAAIIPLKIVKIL
jgi:seryl-tRNA synthetase